jgi:hypothetical protein
MTEQTEQSLSRSLPSTEKRKLRKKLYRKKRAAFAKLSSESKEEVDFQKQAADEKLSGSISSLIQKIFREQQTFNNCNTSYTTNPEKDTICATPQHQSTVSVTRTEEMPQINSFSEDKKKSDERKDESTTPANLPPSQISLSSESIGTIKTEDNESDATKSSATTDISPSSKKRIYGVWLSSEEKRELKRQRQHYGLRCRKCFALLCRDDDFDYKNGQLWINPKIVHSGWEGLIIKGDRVFCQNMHAVGVKRATTWTNLTKYVPVLKVEKTTFIENFVHNPDFANSDKVKNKIFYASSDAGDRLKLSLLPEEYLPQIDDDIISDRYHPEESQKNIEGIKNWRNTLNK